MLVGDEDGGKRARGGVEQLRQRLSQTWGQGGEAGGWNRGNSCRNDDKCWETGEGEIRVSGDDHRAMRSTVSVWQHCSYYCLWECVQCSRREECKEKDREIRRMRANYDRLQESKNQLKERVSQAMSYMSRFTQYWPQIRNAITANQENFFPFFIILAIFQWIEVANISLLYAVYKSWKKDKNMFPQFFCNTLKCKTARLQLNRVSLWSGVILSCMSLTDGCLRGR